MGSFSWNVVMVLLDGVRNGTGEPIYISAVDHLDEYTLGMVFDCESTRWSLDRLNGG